MRWMAALLAATACGKVATKSHSDARIDSPVASDAAGDAPIDAAPFSPAQLPGLALWLSADNGVTTSNGKVNTWADQSGQNNNAGQTTSSRQPALITGVINGLPVIRFDGVGTTLQITDAASLQWGTDDFTIEVVGSWTNSTTATFPYGMIIAKQTYMTSPYPGPAMFANWPTPSPTTVLGVQLDTTDNVKSSTTGLNDGNPRLYGMQRAGGTNLETRIGGASVGMVTTATAIDVSAVGNVMYIGGQVQSTSVIQPLAGDIAEIVAVHGSLSPGRLMQLETYLKTKYGL